MAKLITMPHVNSLKRPIQSVSFVLQYSQPIGDQCYNSNNNNNTEREYFMQNETLLACMLDSPVNDRLD